MAYPLVDKPYGLQPVNRLDFLPYAGATRLYPIANGYAQNLFDGDVVQLSSNGTIIRSTMDATSTPGTPVAGTVGVFMGCTFTSPVTGQKLFSQYWPSGTAANDAQAYIVDDPRAVFKAAVTVQGSTLANTSTTIGSLNPAYVGSNLYMVGANGGTLGNLTTGSSLQSVSGGVITSGTSGAGVRVTTALPWRMVAVVPDTSYTVGAVGSTSGSSTTVTLTAANSAIIPGMQLIAPSGIGSMVGNYITVVNVNGTTLTVSSAITLASGTAITFVGYPEVLVTWNGNFHSFNNTTGV